MRRPGLWVANGHPGNPTQMLSWRPGSLTCYYDYLGFNGIYPYKAANPEATIIVRFQHQRNWQQNPAYFARQLGEQVASKWNDLKIIDPYVYFANENNLHYENGDDNPSNQHLYTSQEFYKKYADWVRMTADIIKNIVPEMKLITPPFAFGHHEDGSPDDNGNPTEGWAGYDYLADTVRDYFNNILTFHAYWGHGGGTERQWLYDPELSTWYAFRWKRVLKLFETRYNIKAKMIIDEAGNFGAYNPDFTDQVIYYAEKCLSDPRVLALTYFLWMDPTNSPGNVPNSWTQSVVNLPEHLNRLRAMPDVVIRTQPVDPGPDPRPLPKDKDTIRVLFDNGQVRSLSLEAYLRAVVPAEVPASWPAEAVKAQTIAARSYAQNAIENPRHNNADICTNPAHCQNYDESKIHERSDAAIQQTKGLIARYNGITVNGIFSANCGGHTRNNDDVFGGKPLPYLQGVACPASGQKLGHGVGFCQQGARTLAQQGRSYEEIVKHYYTGVTLGPPTKVRTSNILGTILDYSGNPAAKVKVRLTGPGQTVEATSQEDGTFRFSNVPGGDYTLELPAQAIRQLVIPTPGEDTILKLTLPAPVAPDIIVEVQRSPGLPLVIGNWGKANQPIRIEAPSRNIYQVMTGSKTEYGVGGFEFYAIEKGTYTLQIEGKRFDVPADGQTIRLTFRKGDGTPPSQPAGIIEGILRNDRNQAVANRRIELAGNQLNRTTNTDGNGYFSFEKLPVGRYIVSVADSEIKQDAIITGQNRVSLALKFAAQPHNQEWQITLERKQGLPLLVGDIGLPNRPIVVIAPSRQRTTVTSGSKLEWGRGGFETYIKETGNYIIEFEDQRFTIPMTGQFTHVVFEKVPGNSVKPVRLVSKVLPRPQAETILKAIATANAETAALFEVVEG